MVHVHEDKRCKSCGKQAAPCATCFVTKRDDVEERRAPERGEREKREDKGRQENGKVVLMRMWARSNKEKNPSLRNGYKKKLSPYRNRKRLKKSHKEIDTTDGTIKAISFLDSFPGPLDVSLRQLKKNKNNQEKGEQKRGIEKKNIGY